MYANATATAGHTGSQLGLAYGHRQDDPDAPAPGKSDVREERPGVAASTALGQPPLRRLGDPICSFFIVSSNLPTSIIPILTEDIYTEFGAFHHGDPPNGGSLPPAAPSADAGEAKQKLKGQPHRAG